MFVLTYAHDPMFFRGIYIKIFRLNVCFAVSKRGFTSLVELYLRLENDFLQTFYLTLSKRSIAENELKTVQYA